MWKDSLRFVEAITGRLIGPAFLQALAAWAESLAAKHPALYNCALVGYAFLGPFLIFALLWMFLLIPGILVCLFLNQDSLTRAHFHEQMFAQSALPIISVVAALALITVLKIRSPKGLLLQSSDVPLLFQSAQAVGANFATRIDKICLTNQFNCAVVAVPKFAQEQYVLYVGFPVLCCMSIAQLESILAHQAGHLVGKHSQARRIVDHQRIAWFTMMQKWRQKLPYLYISFSAIFFWYSPIFAVLSFVEAKQEECEADDKARSTTVKDDYGNALLSFAIKLNLFSKIFDRLLQEKSVDTTYGEERLFARAAEMVRQANSYEIEEAWDAFLSESDETLTSDHPGLMMRLQRLQLMPVDLDAWHHDWALILDNEGDKALTLLGDYAVKAEEKLCAAFGDAKMSHDVSRDNELLVRGNAHYRARRYEQALSDFNQAIKLNPSSPELYVSRSSVYIELKHLDKAIKDCDMALALKPSSAGAYSNRACVHLLLSQWEEAVNDATNAISVNAKHTAAYSFRASAYINLGKSAPALDDLNISLQNSPEQPMALWQRAALLRKEKKNLLALEDLVHCLRLNPGSIQALSLRAKILFDLHRDEEAHIDLDLLIELDTAHGDALITRCFTFLEQDKLEPARNDYENSLPLTILDPISNLTRCYIACVLRQWMQAVEDAEVAYGQGLRQSSLLSNYARALYELGRSEEALPLVEEALAEETHPRFVAVRARVMHGLGRNDLALADINAAIEQEPAAPFFAVRAKILRALGRGKEAHEDETRDIPAPRTAQA